MRHQNSFDRLIRTGDDPILKSVCRAIEPGEPINHIIDRLNRVVRKATRGAVGLAAPQVGFDRRVIILYCKVNNTGPVKSRIMINPVIVMRSAKTRIEEEGCLSYPNVRDKRVERAESVQMTWEDERRNPHQQWFYDYEARVAQHECEHLDGVCKVGDPNYTAPSPTEEEITENSRLVLTPESGRFSSTQPNKANTAKPRVWPIHSSRFGVLAGMLGIVASYTPPAPHPDDKVDLNDGTDA